MSTMEYGLDVSDSSASDVIGRMHTIGYESKNVLVLKQNDYSIPNATISPSLTSIATESGLNISGIKRLGDMNATVSTSLTGSAINFG